MLNAAADCKLGTLQFGATVTQHKTRESE